jgi:hypothetical protein
VSTTTGYVSYTEGRSGGWIAWLTETQPPCHTSTASMLGYPGEVHFGIGRTKVDALANLEADLAPPAPQEEP